MRTIIFDIETSSYPFETLAESQKEYILRYAEKERSKDLRNEKREEAIRYTSLYPFTAEIIAIGIFDMGKEKSFVYFNDPSGEEWSSDEKMIQYKGVTEEKMLTSFWRIIEMADRVVTFNGKSFDAPFLMLRSALLKVKPSKNLVGRRYNNTFHIDLLEQFTYSGLTRKFNLDFYCTAFGIESPKSKGITGMDVKTLYEAGRVKDIAVYCGEDINATYRLFNIWNEYLNI